MAWAHRWNVLHVLWMLCSPARGHNCHKLLSVWRVADNAFPELGSTATKDGAPTALPPCPFFVSFLFLFVIFISAFYFLSLFLYTLRMQKPMAKLTERGKWFASHKWHWRSAHMAVQFYIWIRHWMLSLYFNIISTWHAVSTWISQLLETKTNAWDLPCKNI